MMRQSDLALVMATVALAYFFTPKDRRSHEPETGAALNFPSTEKLATPKVNASYNLKI